jgi:hypothetical protein
MKPDSNVPGTGRITPVGRAEDGEPPDIRVAQQAPQDLPDHGLDAFSVLDSVVAHAVQAGLALQNVRPSGPEAAAVDHALGLLDEIVREARDLAFRLRGVDTRIRGLGPERRSGKNGGQ